MKKQTAAPRRRKFERIVVLVDITVVLLQDDPKQFAAHIFNSVSRILQQCNEHSKFSTIWGYKFFDPCFPHMTARSKIGEYLGGAPMFERFDAFAPNLEKFGKVLDAMANNHRQYDSGGVRGKHIANAINEVIGNDQYTWDPLLASDSSSSDEETRRSLVSMDRLGDSNAIILFSSVPTTWSRVNCFFDVPQLVGNSPPDPSAQGVLTEMFRRFREALKSSKIQVCFVDVPMHQDLWSDARLEAVLKPTPARRLVLKSLSGLVKTVIASELLVVSPTFLPCNLIWNTMADLDIAKSTKRTYARVLFKETTLSCNVQLLPLNAIQAPSASKGRSVLKPTILPATGKLDIVLNSVVPKGTFNMKSGSERCLVQQSSRSGAPSLGEDRNSFGDKVLQLLDHSAFRPGQPGWQLLLLSLASQKSVCEVILRNQESGHCLKAVLEPFTSHSAILTVFEKELTITDLNRKEESLSSEIVNGVKSRNDAANYCKHEGVTIIQSRKRRKVAASHVVTGINWHEYWEREGTVSASTELTSDCGPILNRYIEGGKASQLLQTVDSFLKEVAQPSRLDADSVACPAGTVEGVEQSSEQLCAHGSLPDNADAAALPGTVSGQNVEALASGDVQLQQHGDTLPLAEAVLQEDCTAAVDVEAPAQDGDPTSSFVRQMMAREEAKEYISSVERKIDEFLSSIDVDRLRFAEMIVAESHRSMYVLARQSEDDDEQRSAAGQCSSLDLNRKIASKLRRLLLISPKKLLAKYKDCTAEADGCAVVDGKVREHELQILLRLEMISFDGGQLLEQAAKDQLVDDICKLLDSIQFHLDGGIFGGKNLSKYCDRLLVSRYKQKIPSTIENIFSMMELDGYSVLPPPNSGPASLQEGPLKVVSRTVDLLLGEAGVSQDSICSSEKLSNSATGDGQFGSSDADLQLVVEKGCKRKKGSYHFASHNSKLLRMRKFKSGRRQTSLRSQLSHRLGKPSVLAGDDLFQIVCQTPAPPVTATSCHAADRVTEPANLAPLLEWTASWSAHEQASVEQCPSFVEGTPLLRRRLPLKSLDQENLIGRDHAIDERFADTDRTSNAVPDLSGAGPSNTSPPSFLTEIWERNVLCRDSPCIKDDVAGGPLSFSALLEIVEPVPQKMKDAGDVAIGTHLFHNGVDDDDDDDIEDDDEDGIMSTPFKTINPSDQSLSSLQSSQSEHPDCHKQLDLFNFENTRDGISLPFSRPVNWSRPYLPAGLPYSTALGDTTNTSQKGSSSEVAELAENDSSSRSSPETGCFVPHMDSCPEDVTIGKEPREMLRPLAMRTPLGTISNNSAQLVPVKQYSPTKLCSVSDIAPGDPLGDENADEIPSGPVHDKENQSLPPRKKSTKCRSGSTSAGVCERKTRSRTLLEQNMAPRPIATRRRKTRRLS